MKVEDILSSDPDIVSGAAVFKGTRVPVSALFEYLEAGDSLVAFLNDFPTVERYQAEAAIRLAADDLASLVEKSAA
ncbi:DUF433 domain-containing protein [Mesorhizobium sp. YIM 152430]|uniref:DUF433 domain-containing protein n=1 Tax=Mesorhizobium sp. YIM 152430 TaxID=3031761 RepID=UPI0023D992D5|nr:DUF433 domain-containing protein [Mesorhizobium sp. YIM 152430]MDF1601104.1 DUF433 domain-containing protein [Mesorhizobium sp. YIM 152430]